MCLTPKDLFLNKYNQMTEISHLVQVNLSGMVYLTFLDVRRNWSFSASQQILYVCIRSSVSLAMDYLV